MRRDNVIRKTILATVVLCFILLGACLASEYIKPFTKELVASGITIADIPTDPGWRLTGVVPGSVLITFYRKDCSDNLKRIIAILESHPARLAALLNERGNTAITKITGGIRGVADIGVDVESCPVSP